MSADKIAVCFTLYALTAIVVAAVRPPGIEDPSAEDIAVGLLWPLWVPLIVIRSVKIGLRMWCKAAVDLFRRPS